MRWKAILHAVGVPYLLGPSNRSVATTCALVKKSTMYQVLTFEIITNHSFGFCSKSFIHVFYLGKTK
jgi:hypothetical protein